jgi:dihydroorotase
MLLREVIIVDPGGPHHRQERDVRVENGRVTTVSGKLKAHQGETVFSESGTHLSPGFVDIGAYLGDPGHEEREDINSLAAAARAGGYVSVAVLPNTKPVRQNVADMSYLSTESRELGVDLLPLAALSRDAAGRDLTEMVELNRAGAPAFTDGPGRSAGGSLLKRGLQYARTFDGLVMDTPYDDELAPQGQMHEGEVSVRLGLSGIPTLSETIPLRRALTLLDYTESRLLLHLVSSAESMEYIRQHGNQGGKLAVSVGAHHLTFTDEELATFDPNFKIIPPLRAASDRSALRQAVVAGTVDCIVSAHRARHREEKDLEFSYSAFGARGLETAFLQLLPWIDGRTGHLDAVVAALTHGPRRILNLPALHIEERGQAALTLFRTGGERTFGPADLRGKTTNSPLLGRPLRGRILGTVNHDRLWTSA